MHENTLLAQMSWFHETQSFPSAFEVNRRFCLGKEGFVLSSFGGLCRKKPWLQEKRAFLHFDFHLKVKRNFSALLKTSAISLKP